MYKRLILLFFSLVSLKALGAQSVKRKDTDFETLENSNKKQNLGNELMPKLFLAILNNNIAKIQELIRSGADLNEKDRLGRTALHYAVHNQNPSFFSLKLRNRDTLIHALIKEKPKGYGKAILALLKRGAAIVKGDGEDKSVCDLALAGNPEITRLVHRAALEKIKFKYPQDALAILELILNSGQDIDINAQDINGKTALSYAIINQSVELVKILLKNGANPNLVDKEGHLEIFKAIDFDANGEIIKELIDSEVDVNQNVGNLNPLFYAASRSGSATQYLIDAKADLYHKINGYSPLHQAIIKGQTEAVDVILQTIKRKKVKSKNLQELFYQSLTNANPVHYAALYNHPDIIELILTNIIFDLTEKDSEGKTALHYAAIQQSHEAAELLLNKMEELEDPITADVFGNKPLDYALKNQDKKMIQLLKRYQ